MKEVETGFWQSDRLNFIDKGYSVKGGNSNTFAVLSRKTGSYTGYVRWMNFQYLMFPLNTMLSRFELREIAQFCEERTEYQMKKARERNAVKKAKRHIPGPLPNSLKRRLQQS